MSSSNHEESVVKHASMLQAAKQADQDDKAERDKGRRRKPDAAEETFADLRREVVDSLQGCTAQEEVTEQKSALVQGLVQNALAQILRQNKEASLLAEAAEQAKQTEATEQRARAEAEQAQAGAEARASELRVAAVRAEEAQVVAEVAAAKAAEERGKLEMAELSEAKKERTVTEGAAAQPDVSLVAVPGPLLKPSAKLRQVRMSKSAATVDLGGGVVDLLDDDDEDLHEVGKDWEMEDAKRAAAATSVEVAVSEQAEPAQVFAKLRKHNRMDTTSSKAFTTIAQEAETVASTAASSGPATEGG